jgi:hypothetical protein
MRKSILAHSGEALASRKAFQALSAYDQASLIEFLKSLQVLPPGTKDWLSMRITGLRYGQSVVEPHSRVHMTARAAFHLFRFHPGITGTSEMKVCRRSIFHVTIM